MKETLRKNNQEGRLKNNQDKAEAKKKKKECKR